MDWWASISHVSIDAIERLAAREAHAVNPPSWRVEFFRTS